MPLPLKRSCCGLCCWQVHVSKHDLQAVAALAAFRGLHRPAPVPVLRGVSNAELPLTVRFRVVSMMVARPQHPPSPPPLPWPCHMPGQCPWHHLHGTAMQIYTDACGFPVCGEQESMCSRTGHFIWARPTGPSPLIPPPVMTATRLASFAVAILACCLATVWAGPGGARTSPFPTHSVLCSPAGQYRRHSNQSTTTSNFLVRGRD